MSLLRMSASPVEFTETGFTMLIDGKAEPLPRYEVEVKNLAEVMTVLGGYKAQLGAIDVDKFRRDGNLDYAPNGYMVSARIAQGRAPNGFKQIPRKAFEVRKGAA